MDPTFIQKAHHIFFEPLDLDSSYLFSTRSTYTILVAAMQNKKQDCISNLDNILASFPTRKKGPRELHTGKKTEQLFKGACIYYSALYQ
eukprot:1371257-Ditylum_brightwellii.AAC.1